MEEDQRLLERILDGAEDPRDLPFALLKDITNGFSKERKIGQGGFGEVYKGVLGKRIVAVKRIHINENTVDDRLFRREVTSLMNINHRNVVQFLGVCSGGYHKPIEKDGSGEYIWAYVLERLLCFKYITNGSLDKHITDELRGLEWETRYEIITGICKGLRYLHKERNIIHMDLKPANILLDHQDEKYMVPKITDFGLSRPNKNSHTVGQRYGTLEYMAPEYRDERKTTPSCDIYSLGLIIIEIVTGCKDVPNKDNVLRRWRHRWKKPPTQLQYQQVTRCIDIAGHCRKKKPEQRPTISWIINFLSESESTYWQISPCLYEDDMLRINPLELRLPSELKNEISCLVELTNDTRNCIIAFNIQLPSAVYNAQPYKGIVRPESKYSVKITVHTRDVGERDHANKFVVRSMQVEASEGLRDEDITECMFKKTERFIDEVDLMVVYESTKPQENFKCSEDTTNTPAEEVPEPKNCESSHGSSGKAEATSMEFTNFNPAERPSTRHIINRLDKTKIVSYESENAAEESKNIRNDKVDGMAVTALSDLDLLAMYQDIPNARGETSSKENATEVIVAGTNPCNRIWENTANLDKLNETMHSLNPDIRRCFDFCSIFPRGSKLRRDELVRLWIAQGFVKTNCVTEDMEDVAEGYFQELVSRSFLQPEETSYDTGCFTIHDAPLYLLDKVAGDCFRIENSHRGDWEGDVPGDIQHLLIRYYDGELITEKILGLENLLTLIVYKVDAGTLVEERVFESICKRLPKLRVLAIPFILERSPGMEPNKLSVPESISQLKHLRYLAFRTNRSCMLSLPRALNKLHHVQVLDFGDGKFDNFNCVDLINLRHINSGSSEFQFLNISSLTSLQTISCVFGIRNAPGYEVKQLRDLNKLRGSLEINGLECIKSKEEALESNLAAKERLTELKLQWRHSSPEVQAEVLEGMCPPAGLQTLELHCYSGSRYPDWMVGKQEGGPKDLQELMFWSCSQLGHAPQLAEAFPHLRVLKFSYCHWDALPGNIEHLTSLKKLEIEWCSGIRSLPTLPQSLEEFRVEWCNDGFMKSCQTFRHPNWQKIEHVPRKTIEGLSPIQDVDTKIRSGINHLTGFWRRKKV